MTRTTLERQVQQVLDDTDTAAFQRALRGELVRPGHAAYEDGRKVWNGMVNRKPAMIAYCACPDDVALAVTFARSRDVPLAVRAGGHSPAGSSVADGGLVLDVSRLSGIRLDPKGRIAHAGAGLTLGAFDAATQAEGLATTMGVNSTTGSAGLTLGGGFGKLGRKYGLACDNLLSAEVVTADGRHLRAGADENADLFWGLRGGGGNFGVVTAFAFRLHPVGPMILHASLTYDCGHARDAMRAYRELAAGAPDEVSADAALATGPSGEPVFSVSACYIGPVDEGARAFDRLLAPLRTGVRPTGEDIRPRPYLEIQSAADATFPRGLRYYWKAQFLNEIGDDAIDVLLERFPAAPSRRSLFVFQQVGGAIARVPPDATAYFNRGAACDSFPVSIWESPEDDAANIAWARELWAALQPFASGGVYVNNLGEEGEERLRAAYGDNYPRLVALKDRYDPTNLFRFNQNIVPSV